MRPVVRGKNTKFFKHYKYARKDLIDRLGQYCSYCEMRIPSSLDVEHILPQSQFPDEETNWENFCLACTNCNSTKKSPMEKRWDSSWKHLHITSAKIAARSEFYWIDQDNTFRAFKYSKGGVVKVNPSLASEEEIVAKAIEQAVPQGFFSIWMTVFKDDPDMLNRFINAFPGTCKDCFDVEGKAIPRPGGRI